MSRADEVLETMTRTPPKVYKRGCGLCGKEWQGTDKRIKYCPEHRGQRKAHQARFMAVRHEVKVTLSLPIDTVEAMDAYREAWANRNLKHLPRNTYVALVLKRALKLE